MSSSSFNKSSFQYQPLTQSPQPTQNDTVVLVPVQGYGGQGGMMFMAASPVIQQNQVMMTPQAPVTVTRPSSQFVTPNTYFILTVVLFILLTLFAPETLFIMLPALIVSALSRHASTTGNYLKAKRLGNIALGLNIFAIILAMGIAILMVSLTLSLHPWYRAHDYYYYWGGCYYDDTYETGSGTTPMICVN